MSNCNVGDQVQVTGVVTNRNASFVQVHFGASGCLWVEKRLVADIRPAPPPLLRALAEEIEREDIIDQVSNDYMPLDVSEKVQDILRRVVAAGKGEI